MIFRQFAKVFGNWPQHYWNEWFTAYDALVARQAVLIGELAWEEKMGMLQSAEITKLKMLETEQLVMKLCKVSHTNKSIEEFRAEVEARFNYVSAIMAKN